MKRLGKVEIKQRKFLRESAERAKIQDETTIIETRIDNKGNIWRLKKLSSDWSPWTYQVDHTMPGGQFGGWCNFECLGGPKGAEAFMIARD